MISIAISGACGRIAGQVLMRAVEDKEIKVVAAIDAPNSPHIGKDIGEVLKIGPIGVSVVGSQKLEDELKDKKPDFLVDFTNPEASPRNVKIATKNKVGVVVGTTGLSKEQTAEMEEAIKKNSVAAMISSNFSIGMNVMFKMAEEAARTLKGYDIEIIEAHHRFKKDAPSGTAITLAKTMSAALGRELDKVGIYGRKGIIGERGPDEIGIHAIRAGDIAGEHTVLFGALGERLEIKYQAHTRDSFARGCILAIKWMAQKKSGIYDMRDVLGLN